MSRNIAMVMDLGGTKIKLGLVENGKILSVINADAQSQNGLRERLPAIKEMMNGLLLQQSISANEIVGMGISIPGIVDSRQKKILSIDNKFNDAPDIDLSAWVSETWHTELQLENDARAALTGEWQYGNAKDYDNVVLMTIGTGVGSSAVIEGKILRGKHYQAGVLGGHFTVNINGQKCNCGNYGCVEVEASTWNIERICKLNESYAGSALANELK
ncbi:MAG TPA: ROK family protein, partial [Panacibacter sp.]|nr:ROK family protein [Panacibacter sp.]